MSKRNDDKYDKLINDAGKILAEHTLKEIEELENDTAVPRFDEKGFVDKEAKALEELQTRIRKKDSRSYRWVAAVAVICLVITCSTFLITKPTVSYPDFIENLFFRDNGNSVTISSNATLIPENWSGKYALAEVPLEYEMVSWEDNGNAYWIQYINDSDGYILFSVASSRYAANVDIENAKVTEVMIGDIQGQCVTKEKNNDIICYSIIWSSDNTLFVLVGNQLSIEALLDIAERVMIAG